MFAKLENRIIVQYKVTTKSDLHIGGHTTIEPSEVDNPVIKNIEGCPIIPGSSLKGVLRTEMERLLRGLGVDGVCTPDNLCKTKRNKNKECPICLVFGGAEMAASIRIKDSTTKHKKTLIRDGVAIDRQNRKARKGGKYDIEVVPKGTVFTGTLSVENSRLGRCEHAKLGALLSLIGFFNSCSGSIGHAVSRGFGEVEIDVEKINVITAQDYLSGEYNGIEYLKDSLEYAKLKSNAIADWSEYINDYMSGKHE
jgi:CRISPR-associated RAMP protein (TIGR02581 family)